MTPKQKLFCHYLPLTDFNASKAAEKAGFKHPPQAAHRLLKKPEIQRFIEDCHKDVAMEAGEIIQRFTNIARKEPDRQYKVSDILNALDKLARIRNLYVDKVEHTGTVATKILVEYVDTEGRSAKAPPQTDGSGDTSEEV